MVLSVADFAKKIRKESGAYQGVDDLTLTKAVLKQRPEYSSQVKIPKEYTGGTMFSKKAVDAVGSFESGVANKFSKGFEQGKQQAKGYQKMVEAPAPTAEQVGIRRAPSQVKDKISSFFKTSGNRDVQIFGELAGDVGKAAQMTTNFLGGGARDAVTGLGNIRKQISSEGYGKTAGDIVTGVKEAVPQAIDVASQAFQGDKGAQNKIMQFIEKYPDIAIFGGKGAIDLAKGARSTAKFARSTAKFAKTMYDNPSFNVIDEAGNVAGQTTAREAVAQNFRTAGKTLFGRKKPIEQPTTGPGGTQAQGRRWRPDSEPPQPAAGPIGTDPLPFDPDGAGSVFESPVGKFQDFDNTFRGGVSSTMNKIGDTIGKGVNKITTPVAEIITKNKTGSQKIFSAVAPRYNKLQGRNTNAIAKMKNQIDTVAAVAMQLNMRPKSLSEFIDSTNDIISIMGDKVQEKLGRPIEIDMEYIASKIDEYIAEKSKSGIVTDTPGLNKLREQADAFREMGVIDVAQANTIKQELNTRASRDDPDLSQVTKNGYTTASVALGDALSTLLSDLPGEFRYYKETMGAGLAIMDDLMKSLTQEMKKSTNGIVESFSRISGLQDMLGGIISLSPSKTFSGLGTFIVGESYGKLKNKDFLIDRGFAQLYKEAGLPEPKTPYTPRRSDFAGKGESGITDQQIMKDFAGGKRYNEFMGAKQAEADAKAKQENDMKAQQEKIEKRAKEQQDMKKQKIETQKRRFEAALKSGIYEEIQPMKTPLKEGDLTEFYGEVTKRYTDRSLQKVDTEDADNLGIYEVGKVARKKGGNIEAEAPITTPNGSDDTPAPAGDTVGGEVKVKGYKQAEYKKAAEDMLGVTIEELPEEGQSLFQKAINAKTTKNRLSLVDELLFNYGTVDAKSAYLLDIADNGSKQDVQDAIDNLTKYGFGKENPYTPDEHAYTIAYLKDLLEKKTMEKPSLFDFSKDDGTTTNGSSQEGVGGALEVRTDKKVTSTDTTPISSKDGPSRDNELSNGNGKSDIGGVKEKYGIVEQRQMTFASPDKRVSDLSDREKDEFGLTKITDLKGNDTGWYDIRRVPNGEHRIMSDTGMMITFDDGINEITTNTKKIAYAIDNPIEKNDNLGFSDNKIPNTQETNDIQQIKDIASEAFSESQKTIDNYTRLEDELERLGGKKTRIGMEDVLGPEAEKIMKQAQKNLSNTDNKKLLSPESKSLSKQKKDTIQKTAIDILEKKNYSMDIADYTNDEIQTFKTYFGKPIMKVIGEKNAVTKIEGEFPKTISRGTSTPTITKPQQGLFAQATANDAKIKKLDASKPILAKDNEVFETKTVIMGNQDPKILQYQKDVNVLGHLDGYTVDDIVSDPAGLNYMQGKIYTNYHYLQGNIREKLFNLQRDYSAGKIDKTIYDRQKSKLESILPEDVSIMEIEFSPFDKKIIDMPTGEYKQGYEYNMSTKKSERVEKPVTIRDVFLERLRDNKPRSITSSQYKISRILDGKVEKGDGPIKSKIQIDAQKAFNAFMREGLSTKLQEDIAKEYNYTYNSYVKPDNKSQPLVINDVSTKFKGGKFKFTDAQVEGINHLTNKGAGLIAYGVGVGKTITGLGATVAAMQKGWTKRPLFVVPKATLQHTWIGTIKELFPNYKIVNLGGLGVPDIKRLTKEYGADPKNWIKDGEIAITTFQGLKNITLKPENESMLMKDLSDVMVTSTGNAKKDQKKMEKIEMEAGKLLKTSGRSEIYIEDLGIDHLTIDEVHNMKNIFQSAEVNKEDGQFNPFGGVLKGTSSDLGRKAYLASQYVMRNNNNRGVYALSATPFNNQPIEVYNLLALMAKKRLEEMGIKNINDFFTTFSYIQTEKVISPANFKEIVERPVMKSFSNIAELQKLLTEFIDYKDSATAITMQQRPDKVVKRHIIKPSSLQQKVNDRIRAWVADNQDKDGVYLVSMGQSIMNATSPYFVNSAYSHIPEPTNGAQIFRDSPKLQMALDMTKATLESGKGNVFWFMEQGVDYHPMIVDHIQESLGLKKGEVAFISGKITQDKKDEIAEGFRQGKVKVLVGGKTTSEGIDLQKHGVTTIFFSLNWNPTTTVQAGGRVWRPGNPRDKVYEAYLLSEDSGDLWLMQKYEEKASRINDIFSYQGRVFEDPSMTDGEAKMALLTDPKAKAEQQMNMDKLDIEVKIEDYKSLVERNGSRIELLDKASKDMVKLQENVDYYTEKQKNTYGGLMQYQKDKLEEFRTELSRINRKVDDIIKKHDKDYSGLPRQDAIVKIMEDLNETNRKAVEQQQILGKEAEKIIEKLPEYEKYFMDEKAKIDALKLTPQQQIEEYKKFLESVKVI